MSNSKEKFKKIGILGGIVLIGLIATFYNKRLRSLPQDYTVGEVIKIWKPAKGGTQVGFEYYINTAKYKNSVDLYGYEQIAKPGKRFLVEYPEGHEGAGVMLLDRPVPDSVAPPAGGWDELPAFAR